MSVEASPQQKLLSFGDRFYSYSGPQVGDVSVPASISLIDFENVGLRDCFVKIQPYVGKSVTTANGSQLGIIVRIDGTEVIKSQPSESVESEMNLTFEVFVPKQSSFEVLSINEAGNNTQERGCVILGWYL